MKTAKESTRTVRFLNVMSASCPENETRKICNCGGKSMVSTSTQTPPSMLYMGLAQLSDRDWHSQELSWPEVSPADHVTCSTDWCQMGRELRYIADDLRKSLDISEEPQSTSGAQLSPTASLEFMYGMFIPPRARRRSLPEGSEYFRHPLR